MHLCRCSVCTGVGVCVRVCTGVGVRVCTGVGVGVGYELV